MARFYRVHAQMIDDDLQCVQHMRYDFDDSSDAISFANDAHEANYNYKVWVEIADDEDMITGPEWRVT